MAEKKQYMTNRIITEGYLQACERACGELKTVSSYMVNRLVTKSYLQTCEKACGKLK